MATVGGVFGLGFRIGSGDEAADDRGADPEDDLDDDPGEVTGGGGGGAVTESGGVADVNGAT